MLGVVTLAVLGGALAGFAMAWLGQRREPVAPDGDGRRWPARIGPARDHLGAKVREDRQA